MTRALVTGSSGFIGSRLCARLKKEGVNVIGLDRKPGPQTLMVRNLVGPPIDMKGYDIVYHCAADPDTRSGFTSSFHDNVLATYNILEAMRQAGVKEIVFLSSSVVYGDAKTIPTTETCETDPISYYASTKLCCEELCHIESLRNNVKATIVRMANVIGPGCHGIISEVSDRLKKNPRFLDVYGDGKQRKSYLYIDDALNGILEAAKHQHSYRVYNLGSRDQMVVDDIVEIICAQMSVAPQISHLVNPAASDGRGWPGDVKEFLLDCSRLMRETGWLPLRSSKQAVELTVEGMLEKEQAGFHH